MVCLTKQEWRVLGIVIGLLLMGGVVKVYRTAHPPVPLPDRAVARPTVMIPPVKP